MNPCAQATIVRAAGSAWRGPASSETTRSELARLGLTLDDVRALILTHGDSDHIGFAARLHQEKAIPAYLTPPTTTVPG